jgi:hypothetical protein
MMVTTEQQRELKPTPEAEALYRRWVLHMNEEFTRHESVDRRSEIVRDELHQIYLGRPGGGRMNTSLSSELATNVLSETFDPRNATLRSEYYEDIDPAKFAPRKPLIWFWQMFDRSPLGLNVWLGLRFRCMLGHHLFGSLGKGVKIYRNVDFAFGYNLTIEDNCVIHRGAYLDDRKPIVLREGTVVPDGERVTSDSSPGR